MLELARAGQPADRKGRTAEIKANRNSVGDAGDVLTSFGWAREVVLRVVVCGLKYI
jgi:hypothetical protein